MTSAKLEQLIAACLADFYARRLEGLENLSLEKVLRKKNPYLYRALGLDRAQDIVEQIMIAHVSSSDETIFGNCFFEPIARAAAAGKVADGEGVDFVVESDTRVLAVAVKSGPNWGNADQHKRQSTNFDALRKRLYKIQKQFDPLCGQSYGRQSSEPSERARYRRRSGQAFWQEITGDADFYLKLVRLMEESPKRSREVYQKSWNEAFNRFTGDFVRNFCTPSGLIDWEKLVQFSCAAKA
jgi:Type II restriction endonuclease EcoO109I